VAQLCYVLDGKNEKHEYYQWISLTLLVQSVCFFLPAWLWSYWEKGYIQDVVGGNGIKVLDDILSKGEDHCKKISKEIGKKVVDNMGTHRLWAAKFIFCEILNFSTTVSQIFFTDYFLNGKFIYYGLNMIEYVVNDHIDDRENPMEETFPTRTNCVQHPYDTGGLAKAHLRCILPANIVNQKLYLFLCYWWILLAILGALQLIYRLLTLLLRPLR